MTKFVNGSLAVLFLASNILGVGFADVKQLTHETKTTAQTTVDEQFVAGTVMWEREGFHVHHSTPTVVTKSPVLASRGDLQLQPPIHSTHEFRYYNVPMSRGLQEYVFKLSEQYGISYELILAVIQTESRFNPSASNGIADGLMQINTSDNTYDWLRKETGVSDVYNPHDNVTMGVYYLHYLRQYWINHGVTEHTDSAMLLSFNMGLGGAQNYIRNYGFTSDYTTSVYRFQDELLQEGGFNE